MKKFFLSLIGLFLCFTAGAQNEKYLTKGAVPQDENGMVVFSRMIKLPQGLDADKALPVALDYVKSLQAQGAKDLAKYEFDNLYSKIVSDGTEDGSVVARVEEILVFKKKPLYLDQTCFRYQIIISPVQGGVEAKICNISYHYNDGAQGHFANYKAEEWIADKVAINKSGTKLYPRSGKFRKKTIDRAEVILQGLEKALCE